LAEVKVFFCIFIIFYLLEPSWMREIWYFNKYKILLKKTGWHVQYMLQHMGHLSAIQAVHKDAFSNQVMTFKAMFKLLMDPIPRQHMWHMDFWFGSNDLFFFFSFFSPFSLISALKPLKFQSSLSICFGFRFDKCLFDYYLFYLKWFIKLNFFILSSFNFFIYHIWSLFFFYCYLFCFESFS